MVLARSNRVIDLKNAGGNYEFIRTPRALFAPDGFILPCTDKSKLIHYLEKLGKNNEIHENAQAPVYEEHVDEAETSSAPTKSPKIAIVDVMVLVQQLANKTGTISTVKYFNDRFLVLTADFNEAILVFDTYKAKSLKQKTREKR